MHSLSVKDSAKHTPMGIKVILKPKLDLFSIDEYNDKKN